jgi:transcriptional regulator GlxA family with amidase domain
MRIGIVVFEQVDLLDVGGPYEVLLTASRLVERDGGEPPFEVITLGLSGESVHAYGGLRLIPQATLAEAGPLDLLLVPGAIRIDEVLADTGLVQAIRGAAENAEAVASVCTGAFVLQSLGFLEGRPWTTHWEDVEDLAARAGGAGQAWVRWVDAGEVVSSGGLSSGIAMALHLVDRFAGRDLALRTARQIEYDWEPDPIPPTPGEHEQRVKLGTGERCAAR